MRGLITRSILGVELPLLALWAVAAVALSELTTRVTDWFVMPDELVNERLALSIARSGSPLPRIHGALVHAVDQLYPLLLAPFFRSGSIPDALDGAHFLNAWLMTSACIPAFLLARRVTRRRWAAYVLAVLALATPWLVYAPFLLSEVVAYPAALWAVLALVAAVASPSRRGDIQALVALAVAVAAREQLVVLVLVLPLAVFAFERAQAPRARSWERRNLGIGAGLSRHRTLWLAYLVLAVGAVVVWATGGGPLGVYGRTHGTLFTGKVFGSFAGHVAGLAFGLGIVAFVAGAAWLLANLVGPAATAELQAFACVGSLALIALLLEGTAHDVRAGNVVADRFLFYAAPVVLLGLLCALLDAHPPLFSLIAPAVLVAAGFATHLQPTRAWAATGPLDADSPVSILYHPVARLAGGRTGAALLLAAATVVLALLFLAAARWLGPRRLTVVVAVLLLLGLPAESAYTMQRLLTRNGTSGRPLTATQSANLEWLDQVLGSRGSATVVPYTVAATYAATQRYWRDLEFWNRSVTRDLYARPGTAYAFLGVKASKATLRFNQATGAVNGTSTAYVVQALDETRFHIAGTPLLQTHQVALVRAGQPWQLDWATAGLYDDGWTHPGKPARIRVYAAAGQTAAEIRTVTLRVFGPRSARSRPFLVSSNLEQQDAHAPATVSVQVCVPAGGSARVKLVARGKSPIAPDAGRPPSVSRPRRGGVHIGSISVANASGADCYVAA
jgi:hypothetical protein